MRIGTVISFAGVKPSTCAQYFCHVEAALEVGRRRQGRDADEPAAGPGRVVGGQVGGEQGGLAALGVSDDGVLLGDLLTQRLRVLRTASGLRLVAHAAPLRRPARRCPGVSPGQR